MEMSTFFDQQIIYELSVWEGRVPGRGCVLSIRYLDGLLAADVECHLDGVWLIRPT